MTTPATRDATLKMFAELPPEEQKEVAAEIAVQALPPPSPKVSDRLWYIVVGTFAAVVLGGLLALVLMVWEGKATEVIAPFVTLAFGVLGGLLAPSPVKGA